MSIRIDESACEYCVAFAVFSCLFFSARLFSEESGMCCEDCCDENNIFRAIVQCTLAGDAV